MRVYIDTSVIGGYFEDEFKDWSVKLFHEFTSGKKIPVISDLVLLELENAPAHVKQLINSIETEKLMIDTECTMLARHYIKEKAITPKYFNDALHIAISTVNRLDVLVSWNFKHIVNLNRIRLYNGVNLMNGYHAIEIRTPREVLNEK